jgi:hypothetical protein
LVRKREISGKIGQDNVLIAAKKFERLQHASSSRSSPSSSPSKRSAHPSPNKFVEPVIPVHDAPLVGPPLEQEEDLIVPSTHQNATLNESNHTIPTQYAPLVGPMSEQKEDIIVPVTSHQKTTLIESSHNGFVEPIPSQDAPLVDPISEQEEDLIVLSTTSSKPPLNLNLDSPQNLVQIHTSSPINFIHHHPPNPQSHFNHL